ncbi:MAG: translation initiation factor IF-3 [Candidatus Babeliales bacterium]
MNQKNEKSLPINEQIRASKIQVITPDGENIGVISREEALKMARNADLDLVIVADRGKDAVPIAKIIDFGKVLYAKKKKLSEAKKHQKTVQVKEIKLRPKIGEHDFHTKLKQAIQFLNEGKHVKMTLVFRGREMATVRERGNEMFDRIDQTFRDFGLTNLAHEKDSRAGTQWSRVYTLKTMK